MIVTVEDKKKIMDISVKINQIKVNLQYMETGRTLLDKQVLHGMIPGMASTYISCAEQLKQYAEDILNDLQDLSKQ